MEQNPNREHLHRAIESLAHAAGMTETGEPFVGTLTLSVTCDSDGLKWWDSEYHAETEAVGR